MTAWRSSRDQHADRVSIISAAATSRIWQDPNSGAEVFIRGCLTLSHSEQARLDCIFVEGNRRDFAATDLRSKHVLAQMMRTAQTALRCERSHECGRHNRIKFGVVVATLTRRSMCRRIPDARCNIDVQQLGSLERSSSHTPDDLHVDQDRVIIPSCDTGAADRAVAMMRVEFGNPLDSPTHGFH